jgi:hypothetical protein
MMVRMRGVVLAVAAGAVVGAAGTASAGKLITGKQIKDRSIGLRDLSVAAREALYGQDGLNGEKGDRGPAGAPGVQGPPGLATLSDVEAPPTYQCASGGGSCQVGTSDAHCPAGSHVIAGGFVTDTPDNVVGWNRKVSNGWSVIATSYTAAPSAVRAYAVCVSGSGVKRTAAAAATRADHARALRTLRARASR